MRFILSCMLLFACQLLTARDIIVVIDPGHGGKDHGRLASRPEFKPEKDLNLEIAQKLGNYIESNLSHVKVIYTRTDDSYPTLSERCAIANIANADYFISIHCNGAENNDAAHGTETHINSRDNKISLQFANLIEDQFQNRAARKSRGIKTSDDRHHSLQVLKETNMPSVLVEAGFMSNPVEERYLNSNYGQEIIASAIFRAFRSFVAQQHPTINFTEPIEEGPFYRVQIMSSIDKIGTDIPEFQRLGSEVLRTEVDSKSMYKFKYYVGKSKDKKDVKKLLKHCRDNGFPDAFIVKF